MGGIGKAVGSIAGGFLGGAEGAPVQIQSPISKKQFDQAYGQTTDQAAQQRAFLDAIAAQQGLQKQTDIYNQYGNIASGQGPNPAQAMLANATGANVANQAALMAGQRGAAANPALIARQAAQQGAGIQQQAAGQGAALQAQQQLAALGAQGSLANTMVGNQATQQQNAVGNAGNIAQMGLGANQHAIDFNAQQQAARQQQQGQLVGSLMGAAGTALAGPLGGAIGGMFGGSSPVDYNSLDIQKQRGFAEGGDVKAGPQSYISHHFLGMAHGGKVPAMVSPGEKYLKPEDVKKVEKGANPMKVGEKIPGKPKVDGAKNSYANDTVHKTLDEGGIVLPRSVTKSKNPEKAAADFVAAILAKNGKRTIKR